MFPDTIYGAMTRLRRRGSATLDSDPGTGTSIKFNALRPGTFTATFKLDFDEALTDTATITVTGVAVEDADGNQAKTYLNLGSETSAPTTQLTAYCADDRTVAGWSSSNEEIATVDENGVVTGHSVGTALITATDSEGVKGGIKVVVQSTEVPYFESLEFLTSAFTSGSWVKDSTFSPTKLEYDLPIRAYSTSQLTLQATTLYDTEKYTAVAGYTDVDGEEQSIEINSGAITYLPGMPFGESDVTITLTDKNDTENKTVYVFHVTRPRDTTKTIKANGIVLAPEGRSLMGLLYKGYAEGTMLRASEDGTVSSGTGVTTSAYNYRTYAYESLEAFTLNVTGNTAYTHLRYSTDDGETWTELAQGGGATDKITFPASEDGNPVVKIQIQILDDVTYSANVEAGKDGFAEGEPNTYTLWVEQLPAVGSVADMLTAETDFGEWYPSFSTDTYSYQVVVPYGTTADSAPVLKYTVVDGATVKIGTAEQTPDEDGVYTLALKSTQQSITVVSSDGNYSSVYKIGYKARSQYDVPDKVVDYLCVNSQYTNASTYGLSPELTLTGTFKSLGDFGGYITYYYEDALVNDPKNPYGIDFFVYGNANVDTSTSTGCSFFEPGQVWVSEDGENWYALAGSEHYEDSTIWDYTVTYSKNEAGKTAWTDNPGEFQ